MQNILAIRSLFDAFLALSAGWFITLLVGIMLFLHPENECMNTKSLLITSLFGAPQRYRPPAPARQQNRLQSSLSPREMCQCLCCSTGSRRVLRQKPSDSQSSPLQSEILSNKTNKQSHYWLLPIIKRDMAVHHIQIHSCGYSCWMKMPSWSAHTQACQGSGGLHGSEGAPHMEQSLLRPCRTSLGPLAPPIGYKRSDSSSSLGFRPVLSNPNKNVATLLPNVVSLFKLFNFWSNQLSWW